MDMTDKDGKTPPTITVGSRVRITVPDTRETEAPDTGASTGVVIEDYADMALDPAPVGRDWAPVHRWAIALDDGRLVFAHDNELSADG